MLMQEIKTKAVPHGSVAIWWIGQAGYVFKTSTGKVIFYDAYLSNWAAEQLDPEFPRRYPTPIEPVDIECDYMIITHDHADHLDPGTIGPLPNKENVIFIAPHLCRKPLEALGVPSANIHVVDVGEAKRFPDFEIRATFCVPNEECVIDSIGCLLTFPGAGKLYLTGDSGYTPFLHYIKDYAPDVILACINGRFGNMSAKDAAVLTAALEPKLAIPNHYDLFPLNLADPEEFRRELTQVAPAIPCRVLELGECLIWPTAADR